MQRNGQNPIKATGVFDKGASGTPAHGSSHGGPGSLHCPACGTEVPPKPGFRPSSLKCPKCGKPLAVRK